MASRLERTYGVLFKSMIFAVNPIKSVITKPDCIVHQYINMQALEILRNDKYEDAYNFFSDYAAQLNEGVVWADQDMKSTGHFYHPEKKRGLYGNNDALSLAERYYKKALKNWKEGNLEQSFFYLGASLHLVQDVTVPQHANNRLLDDHRKYEQYIKKVYHLTPELWCENGGHYVTSIRNAIRTNARVTMLIFKRLGYISDETRRFNALMKVLVPLAQKSTAGCMLRFYKDVSSNRNQDGGRKKEFENKIKVGFESLMDKNIAAINPV